MGWAAAARRFHTKRANCINARCRDWIHTEKFPLCPACRLMIWTGMWGTVLTGILTWGLSTLVAWILS